MLKYYCEHCMSLYDVKGPCKVCGSQVTNPISIDVQKQKNSN